MACGPFGKGGRFLSVDAQHMGRRQERRQFFIPVGEFGVAWVPGDPYPFTLGVGKEALQKRQIAPDRGKVDPFRLEAVPGYGKA